MPSAGQEAGEQASRVTMQPMQGGGRQNAYNDNSQYQMRVVECAKPRLLATLPSLAGGAATAARHLGSVNVADFGCATGRNSLAMMAAVVPALREALGASGAATAAAPLPPVFAFFSDLPGNDFNCLFQLLSGQPPPQQRHTAFFSAAVAGSFYDQLFPPSFLALAMCANSLHWLSCDPAPPGAAPPGSGPWNPGTIWCKDAASPGVREAYRARSRADLDAFLAARARELVPGGLLWIVCSGKGEAAGRWWIDLMDDSWRELVAEGATPQAALDAFNLPLYERTVDDMADSVAANGCFDVEFMDVQQVPPAPGAERDPERAVAPKVVALIRAVVDPMVEAACGAAFARQLGEKMEALVASHRVSWKDVQGAFLIVALHKKGTAPV